VIARNAWVHAGPFALFLLVAALVPGCAPSAYYRTTEGQLDSLLTTQAQMVKRMDRMDKKLDEARIGVGVSRATTESRLTQLSERLDVVVGKLEEAQARMLQLGLNVESVKQRVAQSASRDTSVVLDPEEAYRAAYSDYAAGRYKLAAESFREYLKHYPDTEVSDNAQYWVGESLYAQGDFPAAIVEFGAVVDRYPKGDKVPASLLKIGIANQRLGNTAEARKSLQRVIQKYPKSPEAALAKERLAQHR
jgi:tol-pal system protein YbgF